MTKIEELTIELENLELQKRVAANNYNLQIARFDKLIADKIALKQKLVTAENA